MTDRSKQFAKLIVRILITMGLLIWIFNQNDIKEKFWDVIKTARWQFLIAIWGLTVILFWIRSVKMKFILKKQDCNVSINSLFGATTVTAFYSMILPGMLSTGVKWYILKRSTGKGSNVLSSMLYNQISIMVVMTVFGLGALIITNPTSLLITDTENQWLLPTLCSILLVAVLIVTFLLLNERAGSKILKILRFMLRPFPVKIRQKGQEILNQVAVFQVVGWRFHLIIALITIIDTLVGGVITYILAARSANITVPMLVFVWLCAIIYILGRVPISVANLGVREVTLIGFLAIYNVEKSAALLMSIILFSALVVMAVVGAMYQLFWAIKAKKTA